MVAGRQGLQGLPLGWGWSMTWILVIMVYGGGVSVSSVPGFGDEILCLGARNIVEAEFGKSRPVKTVCVPNVVYRKAGGS